MLDTVSEHEQVVFVSILKVRSPGGPQNSNNRRSCLFFFLKQLFSFLRDAILAFENL